MNLNIRNCHQAVVVGVKGTDRIELIYKNNLSDRFESMLLDGEGVNLKIKSDYDLLVKLFKIFGEDEKFVTKSLKTGNKILSKLREGQSFSFWHDHKNLHVSLPGKQSQQAIVKKYDYPFPMLKLQSAIFDYNKTKEQYTQIKFDL